MEQLSGVDASFVSHERQPAPQHIALIALYDPSTAPGGEVSFGAIVANVANRLHLARAFRQEVVRVPVWACSAS